MSEINDFFGKAKSMVQNARLKMLEDVSSDSTVNQISERNGIPAYNPPERFDEYGNPLSYTDIQQKSSHNSYQRVGTIYEQYKNENITSFELDIHNGDPGLINIPFLSDEAEDGDFYVYHDSSPTNIGNLGSESHYPHLSDGLADIQKINSTNPDHDVITLHIDIKDMLDSEKGLGPEDLDRILSEKLGDSLYTPEDLINNSEANTLAEAYQDKGLPDLDKLEGKVIIVLTGGDEELLSYSQANDNPIAFVSANPNFDEDGGFVSDPGAIFYNIRVDDLDQSRQILDQDYILRAYGANDATSYQDALDAGVHHIGTDFISPEDDNAATHVSNEIFHQLENVEEGAGNVIDYLGDKYNFWDKTN